MHKLCIKQIKTFRGADGDTDYYLVIANFKTKLSRVWIRDKTKAKTMLDTEKLNDPEIIKIFQNTISIYLDNNKNDSNKNPEDE